MTGYPYRIVVTTLSYFRALPITGRLWTDRAGTKL